MHAMAAEETIHIYFERKQAKRPYALLLLICALFCLLGILALTLYSAEHPTYEHAVLRLPAIALPPQTFSAEVKVILTGVRRYSATTAHGVLTITNGSIIGQSIPAGFTVGSVATDSAVYVPAGSANGFGIASVSAHAVASGKSGNIPTLAINQVIGSSVYIRNLRPFTGGRDAYSVKFATAQDKHTALLQARGILLNKSSGLHYPCTETVNAAVVVTWHCRFVKYTIPSYMHVTDVQLIGKSLVVDVWYLPRMHYASVR